MGLATPISAPFFLLSVFCTTPVLKFEMARIRNILKHESPGITIGIEIGQPQIHNHFVRQLFVTTTGLRQ